MNIQWFPGHMTKAMRMMEENITLCDGAIFVVDARAPFACINLKLLRIFKDKPVLFLINKSDLVLRENLIKISEWFKAENKPYLITVGSSAKDAKSIYNTVNALLIEKIRARGKKGVQRALRFMVCGVPKTGKSTVINTLCGKKVAQTGDKPGVTKGKQWIKLNDLELLDTPGTMPPGFENQVYARHLAYIGSINDDILDIESLAVEFIDEIKVIYHSVIEGKYKVAGETSVDILTEICKKRGFVVRGGEIDYLRGAKAILDDFRKGKIGKICLETEEIKINYEEK